MSFSDLNWSQNSSLFVLQEGHQQSEISSIGATNGIKVSVCIKNDTFGHTHSHTIVTQENDEVHYYIVRLIIYKLII